TVEVAPLHGDGLHVPRHRHRLRLTLEGTDVEGDAAEARLRGFRPQVDLADEHRNRYAVEVRQLTQTTEAEVAIAPLVGADRRRAPPSAGALLNVFEREVLLAPDGAQPATHLFHEAL